MNTSAKTQLCVEQNLPIIAPESKICHTLDLNYGPHAEIKQSTGCGPERPSAVPLEFVRDTTRWRLIPDCTVMRFLTYPLSVARQGSAQRASKFVSRI